eukprot:m51a1_g3717 hypothetical protein (648) ;mRNA; f:456834-459124
MLRRMLEAAGAPVVNPPHAGSLFEAPQVITTLSEALARAGYTGPQLEPSTSPLTLFLTSERVRAGVNAALASPASAPAWRDVASHVAAAASALPPFAGFAWAVLRDCDLVPGAVLRWDRLASLSTADLGPVVRTSRARLTLVQLTITSPAHSRKCTGIPGAESPEILLTPGAEFRVTWTGNFPGTSVTWACVTQCAEAAAAPPAAPHVAAPASDAEALAEAFGAADAGDAAAAARALEALVRSTSDIHSALISPALLALRGLLLCWPSAFSASATSRSESALLLRALGCRSVPAATEALDEAARAPRAPQRSATALWLRGYWRLLVCGDACEGCELLARSHELGSPLAAWSLAQCSERGCGRVRDALEARRLYALAASAGSAAAVVALGSLLVRGASSAVDAALVDAARLFALASDAGSAAGAFHLAMCFAEGLGVAQSDARAVELLTRAAGAEDVQAQHRLGLACLRGSLGLAVDVREAVRLLRLAAEAGSTDAQLQLGALLMAEQVAPLEALGTAADFFAQAAEQGDVDGVYWLASCIEKGVCGAAADSALAARWYALAAERGHAPSMMKLGHMMMAGLGVPRDARAGERMLREAATAGSEAAAEAVRSMEESRAAAQAQGGRKARSNSFSRAWKSSADHESLLS